MAAEAEVESGGERRVQPRSASLGQAGMAVPGFNLRSLSRELLISHLA